MRKQNLLQMWVVAFFALLAGAFSCSRTNTEEVETSALPTRTQVLDINKNEGVLPGDIAGLLAVEYKGTKSEGREVKEILPIFGSEGDTLMFAVNYKDNKGFTLISATRNYYPILAEAPEGNYREDDDNPGFAMWLDETKAVVAHQRSAPDSIAKYRSAWLRYAGTRDLGLAATKGDNDVFNLMNQSVSQWQSQGYQVVMLGNFLSSYSYDQSLKNNVSQAVSQYANKVWNPSQYVFVLVKSNYSQTVRGPLLKTSWFQGFPFNDALAEWDNPTGHVYAGCTNIAFGQIMKYYQYPSSFNWAQIDITGTDIANFIYTLYNANKTTVSNSVGASGASMENAKATLCGYGYSSQMDIIGYNSSKIVPNINLNRPIVIEGFNSDAGYVVGHAWVCDGYDSKSTSSNYTVMALEDCPSYMDPTRYNSIYSSSNVTDASVLHSMNWGQGYGSEWCIENDNGGYPNNKRMVVNIFH